MYCGRDETVLSLPFSSLIAFKYDISAHNIVAIASYFIQTEPASILMIFNTFFIIISYSKLLNLQLTKCNLFNLIKLSAVLFPFKTFLWTHVFEAPIFHRWKTTVNKRSNWIPSSEFLMACQNIPENKIVKALERTTFPLAQLRISDFLLKTSLF